MVRVNGVFIFLVIFFITLRDSQNGEKMLYLDFGFEKFYAITTF